MRRPALALLALGSALSMVVLAGCTGGASSTGARSAGTAQSDQEQGLPTAAPAGDSGKPAQSVVVAPRDVVRTAALAVRVEDVVKAANAVGNLALGATGRVDEDTRTLTDDTRRVHIVVRVLPGRLDSLITDIGALGTELSRTVKGEDVTTARADLDARVLALATSVGRLRDLLARSGSVSDLVALEEQLSQREGDLESTRAQQKALLDQVSLATLTLDLTSATAPAGAARHEPSGFGSAVAGGWNGFVRAWRFVLAGLGFALPSLLLGGAVVALAVVVARRRRGAAIPVTDSG